MSAGVPTPVTAAQAGAVTELVRAVGGLPVAVLAILLLFPMGVTSALLFRMDTTMAKLAAATEQGNKLLVDLVQEMRSERREARSGR